VDLGEVDADGTAWYLQTIRGWDSPGVRGEYTDREGDHGTWASPVYLGSRPVTLGGTVVAASQALLESAMEQLRAAAGLTDTVLTVWETTPKQATVRRSGDLLLEYVTDTKATFSVMVTAADPRRYDVTQQQGSTALPSTSGGLTLPATMPWTLSATAVAGQIIALNAGTFETRPVLVIDGPVSAPQILAQMPDGSARFLNYSQDLASGDELVIDTDAHTVTLNGVVSRRRFLTIPSDWPVIPAKSMVTFQFRAAAYNSSALLTARWRSAWI